MAAIVTESLTKHYRGHGFRPGMRPIPAVSSLTLQVDEGEVFGFLGPNGAGKSTTIRMLLGYLHPTVGRASVLGHDITRASVTIRRSVGYLPGGIAFYETMTGQEQLRYLGELSGRATPLRDHLVERMELSRRDLGRQIRDYSRGMRQKLGIIQAFQHDPELAILDEPTEGLDPLMQRSFYELLDERRKAGRTIFFSSHILSEVERVCQRVAIIRRGELVALNDVAELLARRRRHVEVRFEGSPPALTGVPGITDVHVDGQVLSCQLDGAPQGLIAALQTTTVHDLLIEPARLEDAFMEFYADHDAADPAGTTHGDETA